MVALAQRFGEYNFGSLALAAYIKLHIHFHMPKFGKQSSFTKFYYSIYSVLLLKASEFMACLKLMLTQFSTHRYWKQNIEVGH